LATWILARFLSEEDQDAVIGDLMEECALKQSDSAFQASWWYWSQVSRSVMPLGLINMRRAGWGSVIAVAIGAFILASIVEAIATFTIGTFVEAHTSLAAFTNLLAGLGAMALGGFVAAWLRPHASAGVALIIVVVVIFFMATMEMIGPAWYHIGFLILGPLAALAGGALLRRTRCKK
jgi:hypothetical protein